MSSMRDDLAFSVESDCEHSMKNKGVTVEVQVEDRPDWNVFTQIASLRRSVRDDISYSY